MSDEIKRWLSDATITHVSYVDKAANKKKFLITKSEDVDVNVKKEDVRLIKGADEEQKLVYGVVYEPDVADAHGDAMSAVDIEKAAHKFLGEYRKIDKQHELQDGMGEVVESYVAPTDMEIEGESIAKGTWIIATKATDEIWTAIKKGEITGYSMWGVAQAEEVAKSEEQSLVEQITKSFESVVKGFVKDNFNARKKQRDFRTAFDLFENVWFRNLWKDNPEDFDVEEMREAASEFIDIVQTVANSNDIIKALGGMDAIKEMRESRDLPVAKAGRKISASREQKLRDAQTAINAALEDLDDNNEEESTVKKEEMLEVMKSALEPFESKLTALEKQLGETDAKVEKGEQTQEEQVEKAATKEDMQEIVKSALQPFSERLDKVEKARNVSKSAKEEDQEEVKKSEDDLGSGLWDGIL